MKRGTGRRRAGADNVVLRLKLANLTDDLAWYRCRLMAVTARCRALTAQAEISDGQRVLAEQLIQRQVRQLMERDSQIEQLQRRLKADVVRTQPIPIVTEAELAAA